MQVVLTTLTHGPAGEINFGTHWIGVNDSEKLDRHTAQKVVEFAAKQKGVEPSTVCVLALIKLED